MGGTFSIQSLYYHTKNISDIKTAFNVALVAKKVLPCYTIPYSLGVETAVKLYAKKQMTTTRTHDNNKSEPMLIVRNITKKNTDTKDDGKVLCRLFHNVKSLNNNNTQIVTHFRAYVWDTSDINSKRYEFFYASFPHPVQKEVLYEIESFMMGAYNVAKDISESFSIRIVRYIGVSSNIIQKMKSDIQFNTYEIDTIIMSLSLEHFDKIVKFIIADPSITNNSEFRRNILIPTFLLGESGMFSLNKMISVSKNNTDTLNKVNKTNTCVVGRMWEQYLGL